jgi:hypothetical protein
MHNIDEGKEILISYVSELHPKDDREEECRIYGFRCTCDACRDPEELVYAAETERRRLKLIELHDDLILKFDDTQKASSKSIADEIETCRQMLEEMAQEPAMDALKGEM